MSTVLVIAPILRKTYGKSSMVEALTNHLAAQIDAYDGEDRERMIFTTCWNWFSGGDTAASVAHKIEEALNRENVSERRWTIKRVSRASRMGDEPLEFMEADGPELAWGEEVEVVPASQLEGAVSSTLAQVDSLMDSLRPNDVGPWGEGYQQALVDLREQLRLRFGGLTRA